MSRRAARPLHRSAATMPALCAALVWAIMATLVAIQAQQSFLVAWLAGGTAATLLLFGFDKLQSKGAGRRVPEAVLLTLVLSGGVLGGWIGMLVFRHKTRHGIFWVVQWLATALYLALFWWLQRLTVDG